MSHNFATYAKTSAHVGAYKDSPWCLQDRNKVIAGTKLTQEGSVLTATHNLKTKKPLNP